jgi:hypothetical protein
MLDRARYAQRSMTIDNDRLPDLLIRGTGMIVSRVSFSLSVRTFGGSIAPPPFKSDFGMR